MQTTAYLLLLLGTLPVGTSKKEYVPTIIGAQICSDDQPTRMRGNNYHFIYSCSAKDFASARKKILRKIARNSAFAWLRKYFTKEIEECET